MILYQEGPLPFPACELSQSALHYRGYRDGQCPTKKWNKGVVWRAGVQKPNCCKNLGGSVVPGALQGEKQGSPRTWLLRRWLLFRHRPQALGLAHNQRVPSSVWQISQGQRCQPNWRCRHVGAIKYHSVRMSATSAYRETREAGGSQFLRRVKSLTQCPRPFGVKRSSCFILYTYSLFTCPSLLESSRAETTSSSLYPQFHHSTWLLYSRDFKEWMLTYRKQAIISALDHVSKILHNALDALKAVSQPYGKYTLQSPWLADPTAWR